MWIGKHRTSHAVTLMYSVLLGQSHTHLDAHWIRWADDLGREITDADWDCVLQSITKVSRNVRFKQIQLFCVQRAYLTPID